jgi:hypothetical protein
MSWPKRSRLPPVREVHLQLAGLEFIDAWLLPS